MGSAEFRKTYQRVDEPVSVRVNGRLIGLWVPYPTRDESKRAGALVEELPFFGDTHRAYVGPETTMPNPE